MRACYACFSLNCCMYLQALEMQMRGLDIEKMSVKRWRVIGQPHTPSVFLCMQWSGKVRSLFATYEESRLKSDGRLFLGTGKYYWILRNYLSRPVECIVRSAQIIFLGIMSGPIVQKGLALYLIWALCSNWSDSSNQCPHSERGESKGSHGQTPSCYSYTLSIAIR